MAKLLDANTSQNISFSDGISIPLTTTPQLFGTLGLSTVGAGENIRTQFTATVALSSLATVAVPVVISIYRGVGPQRVLIYSATETAVATGLLQVASRSIITVTGSDYRPPVPGSFLVYQAFISIPNGIALAPTRTGPESFNAAVYSD
ncbi:hypothetical protein H7S74_28555 [Priestia aryabhattai]|uniref:hypothetical protein n=1 Tax=Priestia aryabhattai TaxID=412384 RepID=UPI001EBA0C48|nr:hypothetical protein [Priestia aryabhattai]MBY0090735.1 hypothetical protein [Priestia aryabhattai]MBY0105269.1 hypothetical protein [Priestia aryabhattai]